MRPFEGADKFYVVLVVFFAFVSIVLWDTGTTPEFVWLSLFVVFGSKMGLGLVLRA